MSTSDGPSRGVDLTSVVGPSRWWQLVAAADDVPRAWDEGGRSTLVRAMSDEDEQITATHLDAARRSTVGWDGDLQSLHVETGPASGSGYRVVWAFERGVAPRIDVSGPDEAVVSSFALSLEDHVGRVADRMAAEDAAAVPPGRAGRIWVRMDALGLAIAVGISVVMILAVAGAVWAWATR